MSKIEMATFTYPQCEWTIKTPFGAEDNADHIKLHIEKHHNNKTTKARITKTELIKLQKKQHQRDYKQLNMFLQDFFFSSISFYLFLVKLRMGRIVF